MNRNLLNALFHSAYDIVMWLQSS